jgi:peptidoglycan/xylan/chitin deacetylase (PgdA/CDA1 family)
VNILNAANLWFAKNTFKNFVKLQKKTAIVTFTFDDVPQSACEYGAKILESVNGRGTFYIAGGLTDQYEGSVKCHSIADLKALQHQGHELGAHGFSHARFDQLNHLDMCIELEKTKRFFNDLNLAENNLNFSYPLGAYNFLSKKKCSNRYQSIRMVGKGVYSYGANVNLYHLGAYPLYQSRFNKNDFYTAVNHIASFGGWLIIYTHDIQVECSHYGCTPALFSEIVTGVKELGCEIFPMAQAISYWKQCS